MKTFKVIAASVICAATLASCAITVPVTATSNNVGKKCGQATATTFFSCLTFNGDASIDTAAKNAGIKKISHVDIKHTSILGIYDTTTTFVYGE